MALTIKFVSDDGTRWGIGEGTLLPAHDIDVNFWELKSAVEDLQTNPPTPDEIASFTVDASGLYQTLVSGTTIGPIPFPLLTWVWRGDWLPTTIYNKFDWFNVPGVGIFLTVILHTSGPEFDAGQLDPATTQEVLIQISEAQAAGIAGLADVLLTGLTDGQVLKWNADDEKWENVSLADIIGGSVATLTDVILAATADGDVLRYDSDDGVWRNAPLDSLPAIADEGLLANLSGSSAVPSEHTLSAILDYILGNTVGAVITRDGTGWTLLAPGTSGYFLKTRGAGNTPVWDSPAGVGTVTSVATGAGLTGGPITGSGTIAFAPIVNLRVLANISGPTAAASAVTLSAIFDAVFGSTRGMIAVRGASAWQALGPGTSGYYLKTGGPAADPVWDSPAGSGTVTSVDTGTGLTGGPVTGSGTIALDAINDGEFIGNISGGSAAPVSTGFSAYIDYVLGDDRGDLLVRGASGWAVLGPGTSGQVLQTGGAGADAVWATVSGTGTVTSVATGTGLTGGPITSSGTVAFASVSDGYILANISGGSAAPTAHTLSSVIDYDIGSTRGSITYRGVSGWAALTPGTSGYVLQSNGAGADPSWVAVGTGSLATDSDVTITSVADKDTLVYDSGSSKWKNQRAKYIVGAAALSGVLTASQKLLLHKFSKAVTFPANLGAYLGHTSEAGGTANATGSTVITVDKAVAASPNSFSNVGSITIGAGGVTPTFATSGGAAVSFAQGDVLRILAPASADATFADFYATLVGYET